MRGMIQERGDSLKKTLNRIEAEAIREALKRAGWIKARAARQLGITERMIGYKIRKYRITKEDNEETFKA